MNFDFSPRFTLLEKFAIGFVVSMFLFVAANVIALTAALLGFYLWR